MNRPSGSGSFEVLTLGLTLRNGSGTDFGASQCISNGTYGVFIALLSVSKKIFNSRTREIFCFPMFLVFFGHH